MTGLVNAVARGMAQIVAPHGLNHIDFPLHRLFLGVEEWTTTQLAQALPLAASSISRVVTKLVDRGLIQRRRLLSDRRVVILTLAEEGMALTQDRHRRVQAYDADVSEGVSEGEMAAFVAVSAKVMTNHTVLARTAQPPPIHVIDIELSGNAQDAAKREVLARLYAKCG